MGAHAPVLVAVDDVERGQDRDRLDLEPGLFAELARDRCEDGLAEFLDAAREAPFPDARRAGALHQEHASGAADDAENADDGPGGVVPGHCTTDSLSLRALRQALRRVRVREFQGHRMMSQSLT